jgi:hypothetical protein
MTEKEAHNIILDLITRTTLEPWEERLTTFKASPYPELAKLFTDYMNQKLTPAEFKKLSTKYVIERNSKLGKALS